MNTIVRFLSLALVAQLAIFSVAFAQNAPAVPTLNGFQLLDLALPIEEMFIGGPSRESIKPIDKPEFSAAKDDDFLAANDLVIGVTYNGVTKAYPARILNHHEVVNDRFGDKAVAVTYSPLTGTAIAYLAEVEGEERKFGISGLVYNNNSLFFDTKTESLWAQVLGQGVAGSASGQMLEQLPATWTTWDNWSNQHPNTLVLNRNTGHEVDYAVNPYEGIETSRGLRYPINKVNKMMPLKERVVGVEVNGTFRAYPMFVLQMENRPLIADTFNGVELLIRYDKESKTALVTNIKGEVYPSVTGFWYSWYAFHPETDVFMLNDGKNTRKPGEVTITTASIQ